MRRVLRNHMLSPVLPALFVVLWQIIAVKAKNPVILPEATDVFLILLQPGSDLLSMGSLLQNIIVSMCRVLAGFIVAVVLAVPLGILMGSQKIFFSLFNNLMGLFRPIPPLAWVPLVLAWFGVSSLAGVLGIDSGSLYLYLRNLKLSMLFIIFIGAFFPVLTSTIYGVRGVKKILVDSALVLGASESGIFRKVLLPAAAPSIVNGMRIGLGVAWMCLVAAEMLPGSIAGVGYLITHAYTIARTDIVIAGMISIGLIGTMLDSVFRVFEDRKFVWQRLSR